MAIHIYCPKCRKEFKLGKRRCNCGNDLSKHGRYRARFKLPSGRWKSQLCDTIKLAQKVEGSFRAQSVHEEHFGVTEAPFIDEAWKKYLAWGKANKKSWRDDQARWLLHVKPHITNKRMNQLSPNDIDAILADMRQRKNPMDKPYAVSTVKQVLMLIKRVFNWSIKRDLYNGLNPTAKLEHIQVSNEVTNPINKKDLSRFLAYLETWENERAALIIKFALYSGRRRGELLNMKWDNVDLDAGIVTYLGTHTKNARTQSVPLNHSCLAILKRCQELKISHWVFPSSTGAFYTTFQNTWKALKKRIALPYRFHDLRHTFASYLASSGKVDILVLKELLGHRELKMTLRYSHLINGALQKGANVADSIFTTD